MELQNISKIKSQKNIYNVFHTLGSEKKANYDLIDRSLTTIKNEVDYLQNYISPKAKLIKKVVRKRRKINTILRPKRTLRNNSSNSSYMKNNSSLSLDRSFKNRYLTKKLEKISQKEKSVKNQKGKTSRNTNIDIGKDKEDIFITDIRMNSLENEKNPINKLYDIEQSDEKSGNGKKFSLKKFLPPIKNKISISASNNYLKTIENQKYSLTNINENNKNLNNYEQKENPMIKKEKKYLSFNEKMVLQMIQKNKNIVGKIKSLKSNFDNVMVNFQTKYKYLNWKCGISDVDKYFIDIDAYKKDSVDLINNKKSFYDKLDDMVDRILQEKQLKEMKNIKKQYGINIKKNKDDNIKEESNADETEKLFLKGRKIKNILREVNIRKKIEKEKREKIGNILSRTENKYNIIFKNLNMYRIRELKYKKDNQI